MEFSDRNPNVQEKNPQTMSWWISSLAISVVCCAILFVVFASYIVDLKSVYSTTNLKIDLLEERQKELVVSLENLQRRSTVQQIQLIQAPAPSQAPGQASQAQPQLPLTAIPAIENAVQGQNSAPVVTTPAPPTGK